MSNSFTNQVIAQMEMFTRPRDFAEKQRLRAAQAPRREGRPPAPGGDRGRADRAQPRSSRPTWGSRSRGPTSPTTTGTRIPGPRMGQDLDQLAINTIRTLSIDAVEKANSGHPGTPMSMAPVAYTLWQRFLRFDPADPVWPNRDRFVLSAGHASMLLYSLLFLAGVRRVDAEYNVLDEPACSLKEIENFRQLHSRTPGHPEYRWTSGVETTTGPLGQGIATSVGMALASKWQAERYNRPGHDHLRLRRLRARRRRLPDGGGLARIRLARRAPEARQPLLDVRQQPHHDRRRHRARLRRRRPHPLRGLRLERAAGRRRQRRGPAAARLRGVQGRGRPADADRDRQPHRVGLAEQAGHRGRARRTARRGGGEADQARLRLARRRPVPGPRRRARALRRGRRPARRRGPRRTGSRPSTTTGPSTATRGRDRDDAAARPARGLGRGPAQLRGRRREGPRHPQGLQQGRERDRRTDPVADRRLRRPHRLDLGAAHLRRRDQLRAGQLRRPPGPLRDPRTRRRHRLQRDVALQAAPAVVDLPHLLRLRAARDTALGDHGAAGDPPLHPRLDRARRGRPDPPADRAAGRRCARSPPRRDPARRRQRGRRGLAARPRPHPRPGRARAHPPERARSSTAAATPRPRACGAAATFSPTPRTASPS